MIKNAIIRRVALLVSLLMLFTSTVNTTLGFIVTKTDSLINTFVPEGNNIGRILINKKVEHLFGEGYVIPDTLSFDFKVDLGTNYASATINTTNGTVVADENGSVLLTVKPQKSVAIEGIEAGTTVTVTEIQKTDSGFAVKDGVSKKTGTTTDKGNLKFEYINIYTPAAIQPDNVLVSGSKVLEGRDWQQGDSFSFTLGQKRSDGSWTTLGTKTITYDADNADFHRFDFNDIFHKLSFDKVGVYTFRITEIVGNLKNVDYDKTVNTFTVRVTDMDMDGKLEIDSVTAAQNATVTESDGQYHVSVAFKNTATPVVPLPDDITVTIGVEKTVNNTGDSSIGPDGFEFVLENTVSGEKQALKSDENGNAVFVLPFTAADVGKIYAYRLFETNQGANGITYDDRVYKITVSVSLSKDGQSVATVTMDGNVVQDPVAVFVNTCHAEATDSPPTGLDGHTVCWLIMMMVSSAACIFLAIEEKKATR